jgi:hypothetical protein
MPAIETEAAEAPLETRKQKILVRGEELLGKVRELIHEGNSRRISVIGDNGATLLEIPLTAGIIGTVMAPTLVAIGAIAALAKDYTLVIEARNPGVPSDQPEVHHARTA